MALSIKFYNSDNTLNNTLTANQIVINADGSCIVTRESTASWATGNGNQVIRYPQINNKIEIVKDKVP